MNEKDLVTRFAEVCADAYVAQYMEQHAVMNMPAVVYDKANDKFYWQSTLTPLSDGEVKIEVIEEGCYGDTTDATQDEVHQGIIDYIRSDVTELDLLEKIEPEEQLPF